MCAFDGVVQEGMRVLADHGLLYALRSWWLRRPILIFLSFPIEASPKE
jgi:hypothetical protein